MKTTMKTLTLAGVLGSMLFALASPSFAATRHHYRQYNGYDGYGAYGSVPYPSGATAPYSRVPEGDEGN